MNSEEAEHDNLRERVDRLEEEIKEREFSFLRALNTLVEDFVSYLRGVRRPVALIHLLEDELSGYTLRV